MAFTQQQVDDLRSAIAEGVTTVSSGGRTVTYRSLADMRATLRMMEDELAETQGLTPIRRRYMRFQRDDY